MTVKGGTTPACAACKYQRRKCSPSCPLAPYFPANQPKMFQNVHRLFGVSNVTKTLERLKSKEQREDAMRSIIYEAEMRERFPVDGCCGVIAHLRHQIDLAFHEMRVVCASLDACRDQIAAASKPPPDCWISDPSPPPPQYGGQFLLDDGGGAAADPVSSIQAQMEVFGIQKRNCVDFDGVEMFDDCRQTYVVETKNEAREDFDSSVETQLDDAAEYGCRREPRGGGVAADKGCRRELRTAAAGFSLTTVN